MPGPFYNAVKGTTSGTPGTGAFTPNAASTGFRAWSNVPTGWIGLVRYDDGSAWELSYSYWNGTTLSRGTNQRVDSSTGSALSLTSSATAAMVDDANEIGPDACSYPPRGHIAGINTTTITNHGTGSVTATGTAAGAAIATTNYLTRQVRLQYTSATTASARTGWISGSNWVSSSSSSGQGGWQYSARFGASQLPTGPRLFAGIASTVFVNAAEPSALTSHYAALGLDSTDTNMQFITNSGAGAGTKIDTGIPLVANGWYEVTLWSEPGSLTVYMLLVRLDTGAIFYGSTATDVPATNNVFAAQLELDLNATNTGTAVIMHIGHMLCRSVA